jgi:hypothetical protein
MCAEQFALHDLRKSNDGIERCTQFMTHRGEKAELGEVRGLRPVPGKIAVHPGLLELGDEFVLFGLEGEGLERGFIKLSCKEHEGELRATGQ